MRKILALTAAAVAATLTMGTANAALLFVDDFNQPAVQLTGRDLTKNHVVAAPSVFVNAGYDLLFDTDLNAPAGQIATNRKVYQDCFNGRPTGDAGCTAGGNVVKVGGGNADGYLLVANDDNTNSQVKISWALDPINPALANGSDLGFFVLGSNAGIGSTSVTLSLLFEAANPVNNFTIFSSTPNIGDQDFGFGINPIQAAALSGGGTLSLVISGTRSWDYSIDQVQITIPEPTSLALVGLALVGAGFAASRRKA